MDKSNENSLQNAKLTPRRTLGLNRRTPIISPQPTSTKNSTESKCDQPSTSTGVINKRSAADECFKTPIKRRSLHSAFVSPLIESTSPSPKEEVKLEVRDEDKSVEDIKAEIHRMQLELEKYEHYKREKASLTKSIEQWKEGGKTALQMLQEEIKPEQELDTILAHFQIPNDIFD